MRARKTWRKLLVDIRNGGLEVPPEIAVGHGAMGFWTALDAIVPGTRHQRSCRGVGGNWRAA
jgi:transposase-like protein